MSVEETLGPSQDGFACELMVKYGVNYGRLGSIKGRLGISEAPIRGRLGAN